MFWLIMTVFPVLIVLAGGSIAPNNPLTFAWWLIVGILGIFTIALAISFRPDIHQKRNMEEAEWYLYNYQQLWNLINKDKKSFDSHKYQTELIFYKDPVNYRNKYSMKIYNDVLNNYWSTVYHLPLEDTYRKTMGWMEICREGEIYQPQYFGIVNDLEKLKNWKPTFEIDYLKQR